MKAIIEGIEIADVAIIGKWDGLGKMVDWSCPAANVNAKELLKIEQAGFCFRIKGDVCYVTSRQIYTEFKEED